MIQFGISCLFCFGFIYLLINWAKSTSGIEKLFLVCLCLAGHLIVTFEIASLLKSISNVTIILLIQIFLLLAAFTLNRVFHIGFPSLKRLHPFHAIGGLLSRLVKVRLIFIFSLFVFLLYAFLLYIQFRFPQNTTDSLYNHLSRIVHWMQQGSLAHYSAFTNIGMTFPYNHSILMMWPMVFLRSDIFVGLLQYVSVFLCASAVFAISREFGFETKRAYVSGLLFVTFPIVMLESITAQNDIVVSAFLLIAFFFILRAITSSQTRFLLFSIASYALAIGTKQYAIFALPGFVSLYVIFLKRNVSRWKPILTLSILATIISVVFLGGYAYIQNLVLDGNIIGGGNLSEHYFSKSFSGNLFQKAVVNTSRFTYQFVSCEGFPPPNENICIQIKTDLFKPLLAGNRFNIEGNAFLLEEETTFALDNHYGLNEESAWYGLVGCIILVIAFFGTLFYAITKKNSQGYAIILTAFVFYMITCVFQYGWGPYVGRYLIFSCGLVMPFFPGRIAYKKPIVSLLVSVFILLSILTGVYSVMNSDSRPLVSKEQFVNIQLWGKQNSIFIQKIAYKLTPFVRNQKDVWRASKIDVRTWGTNDDDPINIVDLFVPQNSILAVLNSKDYFPDYLLYGNNFDRQIIEIVNENQLPQISSAEYLLVGPEFEIINVDHFSLLTQSNGWKLFINESH